MATIKKDISNIWIARIIISGRTEFYYGSTRKEAQEKLIKSLKERA